MVGHDAQRGVYGGHRMTEPEVVPRSSDLMKALATMEARFPVLDWVAAGVPIWPLLRIRWFFAEWERHYTASGENQASNHRAAGRLRTLLSGPLHASRARKQSGHGQAQARVSPDLLFLSDGISFAKLSQAWVDRFCDPLAQLAEQEGLTVHTWVPSHQYRTPRVSPCEFIQPMLDRGNALGAVRALVSPPPLHLPEHQELLRWVEEAGHTTRPLAAKKIASDASRVRALARRFAARLRLHPPRLAFVVSYYSVETMAFLLACREVGVPTVDIQHGVQGPLHPAYAAWPSVPAGTHALLPDYFWVWSDWEASTIRQWSDGTGHAAVVGSNPWVSVWAADQALPGVADAVSRAYGLKRAASGKKIVLVTLQYGLSPEEQLDPLREWMQRGCSTNQFWVRLHPLMLQERERVRKHLQDEGITFDLDLPTELPLPALLPLADAHVTHSSSTAIEAAQFGVPSLITSRYGAELFTHLIEAGAAHVETGGGDEVVAALRRIADNAQPVQQPQTSASMASALHQLLRAARQPTSKARSFT